MQIFTSHILSVSSISFYNHDNMISEFVDERNIRLMNAGLSRLLLVANYPINFGSIINGTPCALYK